jgi:sulfite reductase (NADPH) flavoprotein alpha-component
MTLYSQKSPFCASIIERWPISKEKSNKDTQHIVIDLGSSGITYEPGDSLGVIPTNHFDVVEKTIKAMKASPDDIVVDKRTQEKKTLREFLTNNANISKVTKKLLKAVGDPKGILESENPQEYLDNHELWDFLEDYPEVTLEVQDLCNMLTRIIPRLYSIASSMKEVGNKVHLIVAVVTYETNDRKRYGVCSNYVGHRAPVNEGCVKVYVQANEHFKLPEDSSIPVIMVGPGTGVAPFRSFMQERIASQSSGKNWLFFGDWTRKNDFFYGEYWEEMKAVGKLRLDTAFSRDQEYKIYVQNKMYESGADIWQWFQEGAYFYVCGDASRMAKDVEKTLVQIAEEQGKMSPEESHEYIMQLIKDKRYVKDVY